MPINRDDGRHWCAPDQETPDVHGQWTCPDCDTQWLYTSEMSVWEQPETRQTRLDEQAAREAAAAEEQV